MAALVQNTAAKTKGGGNKIIMKRIQRNVTTGAFEAFTGTDELGGAAGTWHQVGSLESSNIPRDDKGVHTIDIVVVEFDEDRKNLAILAAPFTSSSTSKKEALELEDGTVLESTDGATEDTSLPYWLVIVRGQPVQGVENAFYCVAQLSRAMDYGGSKSSAYNKPKFKFTSLDADGYTPTNPATGETWLADITEPVLTGSAVHGIWAFASA